MPDEQTEQTIQSLVTSAPRKTLKDIINAENFKKAVALAYPQHLKPERFIRVAISALTRVPKLARCTPESVLRCLIDLSALGLEPDGRRAHLIPFEDNTTCTCGHAMKSHKGPECQVTGCNCASRQSQTVCTLIVDYKGIAELVRRSGEVANIHCDVVYQNDEFGYCYGSNAYLKHIPLLEGDRGHRKAAYSFVKLKDGSEDFLVWGMNRVHSARDRSKAKDSGPWSSEKSTDWDEMAKKAVFRNHSKWLPLSADLRDQIEKDDEFIDTTGFELESGSQAEANAVAESKIREMKAAEMKSVADVAKDAGKEAEAKTAPEPSTGETAKQEPENRPRSEPSAGHPKRDSLIEQLEAYRDKIGERRFLQILGAHGFNLPEGDKLEMITAERLTDMKPDFELAIKAMSPHKFSLV